LLIPGGVLFGTSYVFSMFVAVDKTAGMSPYGVLGPNEVPYDPSLLVVPVLGPWLALDTRVSYDCPATGGRYTSAGGCPDANRQREIWTAILIADGVVQLVGATFPHPGPDRTQAAARSCRHDAGSAGADAHRLWSRSRCGGHLRQAVTWIAR
jgi:hypothetical protein